MDIIPSLFLAVSYVAVFVAGTQYGRAARWLRSKIMAGKPNGPQKPGRHVRSQLQEIEMDLICADKNVGAAAEKDFGASRAQTFIGKALYKVKCLLSLGVDDSDNGNGE